MIIISLWNKVMFPLKLSFFDWRCFLLSLLFKPKNSYMLIYDFMLRFSVFLTEWNAQPKVGH